MKFSQNTHHSTWCILHIITSNFALQSWNDISPEPLPTLKPLNNHIMDNSQQRYKVCG